MASVAGAPSFVVGTALRDRWRSNGEANAWSCVTTSCASDVPAAANSAMHA